MPKISVSPAAKQEQQHAKLDAVEKLFDEIQHALPLRPRASGRCSPSCRSHNAGQRDLRFPLARATQR